MKRHNGITRRAPLCRYAVIPLILGAVAGAPSRGAAQAPVVDSIAVVTHDIFTPSEVLMNPGFGAANALHIHTRAYVVRRELLFRAGQPLDTALVFETVRNLRAMGLFRRVEPDTFRANGKLVVRIQTYDGWSTALELNMRSTGGAFTWSTGLSERNVAGTGNAGRIRYRKDPDRNVFTVEAGLRRLFGLRLQTNAQYDRQSDGHVASGNVGVPFRSLSDRRAFDVQGITARVHALQFRNGTLLQVYQRRLSRANLIATTAVAAGGRGYVRVGLWGQVKNEEYIRAADTLLTVPDTLTGAVAVHLRWLRAQFVVATHYNGFAQEEDVDLSSSLLVGGWVAPRAFGYARSGIGPFGEAQFGIPLGASFARFWVRANGLFTGAGLDSGRVQAAVTFAARIIPRNATIFRVDVARLKGQAPGSELDLGHGLGPRAFGPHAFTGTRAVWGTIEHRWFLIDELLGVIGLGVAGFFDYGGAWYVDQPRRLGGDVGVGLRLGPTRATGTGLGRFDLAYRFGDGAGGGEWVFSVGRSINY